MAVAIDKCVDEVLPPVLGSDSQPPALLDGTTRLYIAYPCPFAQRTWITRNYKGLQETIKLVAIDLQDKPVWYKEKVYSAGTVPSLEYRNEVKGESLDLIKFIDAEFEGPSLLPDDAEKKEFAEELIAFTGDFTKAGFTGLKGELDDSVVAAFDKLEEALKKYPDGPFFLGEFSLVDIAFVPFVERFSIFYRDIKKYDIFEGRPKLVHWFEELNKIKAYKQTRQDPAELLESTKKRLGIA